MRSLSASTATRAFVVGLCLFLFLAMMMSIHGPGTVYSANFRLSAFLNPCLNFGVHHSLTNASQDYRSFEDVAESVTAYMLYPEYFRLRAAAGSRLQAKYDYIRTTMFGGVEFENPNLVVPSNYTVPSTMQNWGSVNEVLRFRITDIRVKP